MIPLRPWKSGRLLMLMWQVLRSMMAFRSDTRLLLFQQVRQPPRGWRSRTLQVLTWWVCQTLECWRPRMHVMRTPRMEEAPEAGPMRRVLFLNLGHITEEPTPILWRSSVAILQRRSSEMACMARAERPTPIMDGQPKTPCRSAQGAMLMERRQRLLMEASREA
jgi:hypothetical protein